jgi:hypothetical protein
VASEGNDAEVRSLVSVRPDEQSEQLQQVLGWGREQFFKWNLNALDAAFVPEPVKVQLVERLLQGYRVDWVNEWGQFGRNRKDMEGKL